MSPIPEDETFDPRTYAVIGAAQEVHSHLGPGFLEQVYHLALANELRRRGIPFELEVETPVIYKGARLDCTYRMDVLAFGSVVVELKALKAVGPIEEAQTMNYLKASSLEVALLLNFGGLRLEVKRFAMTRPDSPSATSASSAVGSDA